MSVAVVDVETTGASPRFGDRCTEVGIARYEGGVLTREYAQLVNPHRLIPQSIVRLTGISNDMVADEPPLGDKLGEIVDVLRADIIVGHNVRFDLGFLAAEFQRAGTTLTGELGSPHVLDTVRIARRQFGRGGNGLQKLSRRLGVVPTDAHRALADAVTTGQVLEIMLAPHGGWDMPLVDVLRVQGGPMPIEPKREPSLVDLPAELVTAIETRSAVVMTYLDARRKETQRTVEPLEIRRGRGTASLVAWCRMRQDRRTFKVDRIVRVEKCVDETHVA
ncbi:MAG: exonuclease domain-containing protein [Planctomycetota bacterium]